MRAVVSGTLLVSSIALLEHCQLFLDAVLCFLFFYFLHIFVLKSFVFVFEPFEALLASLFTFVLLQCLLMGFMQVNYFNDRDD